ncbi:hypothetical protein RHMOL_Rhmol08G0112100 [Rhododendron molle]|uniref:Uncharacterized protein n=1 Tax=Rhododendron molle TaxID=49168 RepID=A0ACC0MM85_RHOML|nr:hypothetical protein RHMOL_Rhmol08G0112100 [Rhododendron molle]
MAGSLLFCIRKSSSVRAVDYKPGRDARREARKAFLALSSDDTAAQRTGSEDVKGDLGNIVELPMDNDHQSPHSTPVGRLPSCWLYT